LTERVITRIIEWHLKTLDKSADDNASNAWMSVLSLAIERLSVIGEFLRVFSPFAISFEARNRNRNRESVSSTLTLISVENVYCADIERRSETRRGKAST